MEALQNLRTAQEVAALRERQVENIVGKRLAAAYRSAEADGKVKSAAGSTEERPS
jgi:hypothetical protein